MYTVSTCRYQPKWRQLTSGAEAAILDVRQNLVLDFFFSLYPCPSMYFSKV